MQPDHSSRPHDAAPTPQAHHAQPAHGLETLKKHETQKKAAKGFLSIIVFFILVFLLAGVLNRFVFQSYFVDGTSMTPTLHNNDRLIIDKVEKTGSELAHKPYIPARGQIIVIDSSVSSLTEARNEQIIKRVIGLPGDHVHIENGVVTITNASHPDGFNVDKALNLHLDPTVLSGDQATLDYDVTGGEVFVLGDNRGPNGSYDSRFFLGVSSDKIIGRLWARVWPLNTFGWF